MKLIILLAVVALAVARPDGDHYDSKYDDFNIDELIGSDRLMKAYTNCFNGGGKCTPEGADFKKWIPEAIQSSCGKCTDKQKVLVAKFLKALQSKLPEEYETLSTTYNANGKYTEELKKFVEKYAA